MGGGGGWCWILQIKAKLALDIVEVKVKVELGNYRTTPCKQLQNDQNLCSKVIKFHHQLTRWEVHFLDSSLLSCLVLILS